MNVGSLALADQRMVLLGVLLVVLVSAPLQRI